MRIREIISSLKKYGCIDLELLKRKNHKLLKKNITEQIPDNARIVHLGGRIVCVQDIVVLKVTTRIVANNSLRAYLYEACRIFSTRTEHCKHVEAISIKVYPNETPIGAAHRCVQKKLRLKIRLKIKKSKEPKYHLVRTSEYFPGLVFMLRIHEYSCDDDRLDSHSEIKVRRQKNNIKFVSLFSWRPQRKNKTLI